MPKPDVTADEAFLLHRALMEVPRSGGTGATWGAPHRLSPAPRTATPTAMSRPPTSAYRSTWAGRVECVAQHERRMHPVLAHARKVGADGPVAGGSSISDSRNAAVPRRACATKSSSAALVARRSARCREYHGCPGRSGSVDRTPRASRFELRRQAPGKRLLKRSFSGHSA